MHDFSWAAGVGIAAGQPAASAECSWLHPNFSEPCVQRPQSGIVPAQITVFHGQRPPNISPRQYIERIATYSGCSPCCLAMGMKYLEKLREKDAMYELNSLNFHRLVLTATLIASKFVDDFYYSNGYWAKVRSLSPSLSFSFLLFPSLSFSLLLFPSLSFKNASA